MTKRNRPSLDISTRPETIAIMGAVAAAYGISSDVLTLSSTQGILPYSSPTMRARRIAIIALHKQWDNARAISKVFQRHASSVWTVLNGASDAEHAAAGEIVGRLGQA